MDIPKYIDNALKRRTKYALLLNEQMFIVDKWLDENNIQCELEDTHGGAELYINPQCSELRIRQAIKETHKV